MMKAAVFSGPGRVELVDLPVPVPGPEEVLVRVHYCGICGSDLEAYHTGIYEPGLVIGHEFAGEVAAVGEKVERWAEGDRVTVNDALPCGRCLYCGRKMPTLCEDLIMPGVTHNGGMAEYVLVPQEALHLLPDTVTTRKGALVEPLAVALHGVKRSAMKAGDPVLVVGAGPIGLLTLKSAFLAGAREAYLSEMDSTRAAMALKLGASKVFDPSRHNLALELNSCTNGEGPSVVYVCTGATAAFEEAVTLVRKGGQIMVLGVAVEPVATDFLTVVLHELEIRGSYLGYDQFDPAMEYIARDEVDVEALVSSEIGLEEVVERGFEMLETPGSGAIKILVKLIT
ncbi:MAG: alcohol dehydrogenase catalytic domain-containing protein [Pseudomonadota bacterium]